MKTLKIAGVAILVLGLVLGLTLPTLAASDNTESEASNIPPEVLVGKVVSVEKDARTFVIQSEGQELTISTNIDTEYFKVPVPRRILSAARNRLELGQDQVKLRPMPQKALGLVRHRAELKQQVCEKLECIRQLPRFHEEATFEDIAVDAWVKVRLVPGEDNFVAESVLIIKSPDMIKLPDMIKPPVSTSVVGTVTGVSPADETITIAPIDGGEEIVLKYNENPRFILRGTPELEGQSARAVYDAEMVAKAVFAPVKVPEIVG